jgi:hypothetical protein
MSDPIQSSFIQERYRGLRGSQEDQSDLVAAWSVLREMALSHPSTSTHLGSTVACISIVDAYVRQIEAFTSGALLSPRKASMPSTSWSEPIVWTEIPTVEHHDDETVGRVSRAIQELGFTDTAAFNIINHLLNAGILFRERRSK